MVKDWTEEDVCKEFVKEMQKNKANATDTLALRYGVRGLRVHVRYRAVEEKRFTVELVWKEIVKQRLRVKLSNVTCTTALFHTNGEHGLKENATKSVAEGPVSIQELVYKEVAREKVPSLFLATLKTVHQNGERGLKGFAPKLAGEENAKTAGFVFKGNVPDPQLDLSIATYKIVQSYGVIGCKELVPKPAEVVKESTQEDVSKELVLPEVHIKSKSATHKSVLINGLIGRKESVPRHVVMENDWTQGIVLRETAKDQLLNYLLVTLANVQFGVRGSPSASVKKPADGVTDSKRGIASKETAQQRTSFVLQFASVTLVQCTVRGSTENVVSHAVRAKKKIFGCVCMEPVTKVV